jgi:putative tryptophan/tyrosine transport system substrate-binding protein
MFKIRPSFSCIASVIIWLGTLAPVPCAALAAEKIWHIGLCHVGLDHEPPSLPTLKQALAGHGYVDGRNLRFDWRNQESEETANEAMRSWVAAGVDLIVAFEDQCVRAARAATSSIPIIFVHIVDPVTSGYIASLARPGGNITGPVSNQSLVGKRLGLLKELLPGLGRILVLTDPSDPLAPPQVEQAREASAALNISMLVREAETAADLEAIFAELRPNQIDGVIIASPDLSTNHMHVILDLADKARIPVAAHRKGWVEMGAILSYAPDFAAAGPVAADYIDRIFKGAHPSELPVNVLSQVQLVINLRKAKEFGVEISPRAVALADEVIE